MRLWRRFETGIKKLRNQREKVMRNWKDLTITDCRIRWVVPEPSPSLLMENLLMLRWLLSVNQKHHYGFQPGEFYIRLTIYSPTFSPITDYSCTLHFEVVVFQKIEAWSSCFRNNGLKMLDRQQWKCYQGERTIIFISCWLQFAPFACLFKTSKQIVLTNVFESLHPILQIAETWRLYYLTMAICKQSTWSKSLNSSTFPTIVMLFSKNKLSLKF